MYAPSGKFEQPRQAAPDDPRFHLAQMGRFCKGLLMGVGLGEGDGADGGLYAAAEYAAFPLRDTLVSFDSPTLLRRTP